MLFNIKIFESRFVRKSIFNSTYDSKGLKIRLTRKLVGWNLSSTHRQRDTRVQEQGRVKKFVWWVIVTRIMSPDGELLNDPKPDARRWECLECTVNRWSHVRPLKIVYSITSSSRVREGNRERFQKNIHFFRVLFILRVFYSYISNVSLGLEKRKFWQVK